MLVTTVIFYIVCVGSLLWGFVVTIHSVVLDKRTEPHINSTS
jgi:hypothetical protein